MNRAGLCPTVLPQLPHLRGGGHRDSTWPRLAGRPGAGELAGGRVSAWERLTLPAPDSVIVSLSLLASKVIGNSQKISNYPKKKKKKAAGASVSRSREPGIRGGQEGHEGTVCITLATFLHIRKSSLKAEANLLLLPLGCPPSPARDPHLGKVTFHQDRGAPPCTRTPA